MHMINHRHKTTNFHWNPIINHTCILLAGMKNQPNITFCCSKLWPGVKVASTKTQVHCYSACNTMHNFPHTLWIKIKQHNVTPSTVLYLHTMWLQSYRQSTSTHQWEHMNILQNLKKLLQMEKVLQTIQLVTCSLAVEVASFSKWISMSTDLLRCIMIWIHQVISCANYTVNLSKCRPEQRTSVHCIINYSCTTYLHSSV